MFFDKICTIYNITYDKVDWSSSRVSALIYENIKCNFEVKSKWLQNLEIWKNADLLQYVVVLEIDKVLVRNNQQITLIDDVLWPIWEFIISDIQSFKSIRWWIDNITFNATLIEWQL